MKRTSLWSAVAAIITVAVFVAAPVSVFAATEVSLLPSSYVTLTGADGDQDVSVLEISNQTGTTNNTAESLTLLTPDKAKYQGYSVYTLPEEVNPATITSIQAQINYYGPKRKQQTWSWTIYDWVKKKWVKLGDNTAAVENTWSPLALNLKTKAGTFGNTVGPVHRLMLVMVKSNNNKYDAAMDLEKLVVTTSEDVVIVPPPDWTPPPSKPIWVPPPGTTWQWQLTVPVDTSYDVQMYDIDIDDAPQATIDALHNDGRIVICYFSPGSYEKWREDANQFPKIVIGKKYIGWNGEYWLDIRQRGVLEPIMRARLDKAVEKGCDGVEPDNIHGFTQPTGFPLTAEDQLEYNLWLAEEAHARSLSIGLKNDLEQIDALVGVYDWALNEQCYQYDECDVYDAFIDANKAVFGTEYEIAPASFCPQANDKNYSFIRKHYDLDAWVIACWDF